MAFSGSLYGDVTLQNAHGILEVQFDNIKKVRNVVIHFTYDTENVQIVADLSYRQDCPEYNRPKFSGDAQVVLHGITDSGIPSRYCLFLYAHGFFRYSFPLSYLVFIF